MTNINNNNSSKTTYSNSSKYYLSIISIIDSNLSTHHKCLKCLLDDCNRILKTKTVKWIPIKRLDGSIRRVPKITYLFNSLTHLGWRSEKSSIGIEKVVRVIKVLLEVNVMKSKTIKLN